MDLENVLAWTKRRDASTTGQRRKEDSDFLMEFTWGRDIQSRKAYLYDYYHDGEMEKNTGLHPGSDEMKQEIDVKFIISAYDSISKDQVAYHIQFLPSHQCNLEYWDHTSRISKAGYPVGLYIDIPDDEGVYHRWLICWAEIANQFPKYFVLPCNYNLQWVLDGKLYHMWGVMRSRNSYNSGTWRDNIVQTAENQDQIWLPFNEFSRRIFYDQRLIISSPMEQPVTWKVSKLENTHPFGINKITLAQDKFDPNTDYVDLEKDIMIADYFASSIQPTDALQPKAEVHGEITYLGVAPTLTVWGGARTFEVSFYRGNEILDPEVNWDTLRFESEIENLNDLIVVQTEEPNKVKVKFTGDEQYLGKVIKMSVENGDGSGIASIEMEVVSL